MTTCTCPCGRAWHEVATGYQHPPICACERCKAERPGGVMATWIVNNYGITVTCVVCHVSRHYRDTVDDVAWASVEFKSHADCGSDDPVTHVDLTYCESLQEWSTLCTCSEGVPCADRLRDTHGGEATPHDDVVAHIDESTIVMQRLAPVFTVGQRVRVTPMTRIEGVIDHVIGHKFYLEGHSDWFAADELAAIDGEATP